MAPMPDSSADHETLRRARVYRQMSSRTPILLFIWCVGALWRCISLARGVQARRQTKTRAGMAEPPEIYADGGSANAAAFDATGQIDYLRAALAPRLRWGAGLRYAFGTGTSTQPQTRDSEHIVFAPVLLGAWWRPRSAEELEVLAGAGPAAAHFASRFSVLSGAGRSTSLTAIGFSAELALAYALFLTTAGARPSDIPARRAAVEAAFAFTDRRRTGSRC
jgi:hypothetical protein